MATTLTGRDLVTSALRLIGAVAEGETLSGPAEAAAMSALNQLIDGWATQALTILTVGRHVFSLVANQATYTIGPSGSDWVMARPQNIENAGLVLNTASPSIEIPLYLLTDEEYAAVGIKALTSLYPTEGYYNPTMPNGTFFLWPTPTISTNDLAIYTPDVLSQFPDATTPVTLAPMYSRALRFNVAVDLAPEYGIEPSQTVLGVASASLANLKLENLKPSIMSIDEAHLQNRARYSTFNVYTNTGG